jgi:hypothetical protein
MFYCNKIRESSVYVVLAYMEYRMFRPVLYWFWYLARGGTAEPAVFPETLFAMTWPDGDCDIRAKSLGRIRPRRDHC